MKASDLRQYFYLFYFQHYIMTEDSSFYTNLHDCSSVGSIPRDAFPQIKDKAGIQKWDPPPPVACERMCVSAVFRVCCCCMSGVLCVFYVLCVCTRACVCVLCLHAYPNHISLFPMFEMLDKLQTFRSRQLHVGAGRTSPDVKHFWVNIERVSASSLSSTDKIDENIVL